MTFWKAVRLFRKEYKKARKNEFVRKPVAHALFQTWRMADLQGGSKGNG